MFAVPLFVKRREEWTKKGHFAIAFLSATVSAIVARKTLKTWTYHSVRFVTPLESALRAEVVGP